MSNEKEAVFESSLQPTQYDAVADPDVVASPFYKLVHEAFQSQLTGNALSVAGAAGISKLTAAELIAGDPEKGHEPLTDIEISQRVMELAAQTWARHALERCEFAALPNAEGDEVTSSFTAVVLHPNDFGQLMTNLESVVVTLIERLMSEVAEVPYGFNPGQKTPPAMN